MREGGEKRKEHWQDGIYDSELKWDVTKNHGYSSGPDLNPTSSYLSGSLVESKVWQVSARTTFSSNSRKVREANPSCLSELVKGETGEDLQMLDRYPATLFPILHPGHFFSSWVIMPAERTISTNRKAGESFKLHSNCYLDLLLMVIVIQCTKVYTIYGMMHDGERGLRCQLGPDQVCSVVFYPVYFIGNYHILWPWRAVTSLPPRLVVPVLRFWSGWSPYLTFTRQHSGNVRDLISADGDNLPHRHNLKDTDSLDNLINRTYSILPFGEILR